MILCRPDFAVNSHVGDDVGVRRSVVHVSVGLTVAFGLGSVLNSAVHFTYDPRYPGAFSGQRRGRKTQRGGGGGGALLLCM